MTPGFRPLLPLLATVLLGCGLDLLPVPGARFQAAGPDLKEFRTTATAITTRISRAAPEADRLRGYLGIHPEPGPGGQVVVAQVEADSPAAKAGIRPGDLLREVAGRDIGAVSDLRDLLQDRTPGDDLPLVILRQGRKVRVTVTLGAVSRPLTSGRRAVLGIQVQPAEDRGVRVMELTPGMPASAAGLQVGDVILKVDGAPLAGFNGLGSALGGRRPGDRVSLTLARDGKTLEVQVTLTAPRGPGPGRWDDRKPTLFRRPVYRLAVVPVEFPDVRHNRKITPKEWDRALFSLGSYTGRSVTGQRVYGSLADYYREQSCGALRVEGKVFDHVEVRRKRDAYAADERRHTLLTEALDQLLAREGPDALEDYDGLFFLYAGGRVMGRRGGLYWPHRASLSYRGRRWAYIICPEGGERMGSISVVAHEFGHLLGLPDLYARPENPGSEGLGVWCTMSVGHGRDGKPLHLCAWCKEQLGWLKPAVLDPTIQQKLVLSPVEGSARECFKVLIRRDGSEYLLLENRVRKGFDRDLPAEGLLIWRVVNGRPVLEESHGITTPDGPVRFLGSVPYPSPSNNAFTPYTTPSSQPVRGAGLPVHLTNIRRLPDGRVAFLIGYEYL